MKKISEALLKEHKRKWTQDVIAKRRAEWFLLNGPCKICGSSERLVPHHTDPNNKESHHVWTWEKSRREAELSKCIVLCYPCHRIIHGHVPQHGTVSRYRDGKCRCDKCKLAKSLYTKKLKEKHSLLLKEDTCEACRTGPPPPINIYGGAPVGETQKPSFDLKAGQL